MPECQYDPELVIRTFRECGTQLETARRLGMLQSTVSKILRRHDICLGKTGRRRVHQVPMDEIRARYEAGETLKEIAPDYGVDGEMLRKRWERAGIPRRPKKCRSPAHNYQWKGGRAKTMHYYRRQSYEVAAICLGQPLPLGWVIHHADEDPRNNQPENLILFPDRRDHPRFHQQLLKLQRQGRVVDATRLALESGGQALPPPPHPIVLPRGRDQPDP